jgi:hypothetical protein
MSIFFMGRIIYNLVLGTTMAALFVLTPVISKANTGDPDNNDDTYYGQQHQNHDIISDWFRTRDVHGREHWHLRDLRDPYDSRPGFDPSSGTPGAPGNSVPLDEGTVFLLIVGLTLGAKMLYHRRKELKAKLL